MYRGGLWPEVLPGTRAPCPSRIITPCSSILGAIIGLIKTAERHIAWSKLSCRVEGCYACEIHCSHGNRNYIPVSISADMNSLFICCSTWFPSNFNLGRQVLGTLWFFLSVRPNSDSRYRVQPVWKNWPLYFTQCLFGLVSARAVRVEVMFSCLNFATGFSSRALPSMREELEGPGVRENCPDLTDHPVNRPLCTGLSPTVEYPRSPMASCPHHFFRSDCHWSNWLINCPVSRVMFVSC